MTLSIEYNDNFSILNLNTTKAFVEKSLLINSTLLSKSTWFLWMSDRGAKLDWNSSSIQLDSDLNILEEAGSHIDIKEFFSLKTYGKIYENKYGVYDYSSGLVMPEKLKWRRRNNLLGTELKGIVLKSTGVLALDKSMTSFSTRNINQVPHSGIFPDILESMAESLNFTFALKPSRDKKWGARNQITEKWNGAIKDIQDGIVDFAPISMSITWIRSTAIDFSKPILAADHVFMIGSHTAYSWNTFNNPFSNLAWLILYIFIFFVSLFFTFIAKFSREKKIDEFRLRKCFTFVYGAFSGFAARRWSVTPMMISGR